MMTTYTRNRRRNRPAASRPRIAQRWIGPFDEAMPACELSRNVAFAFPDANPEQQRILQSFVEHLRLPATPLWETWIAIDCVRDEPQIRLVVKRDVAA